MIWHILLIAIALGLLTFTYYATRESSPYSDALTEAYHRAEAGQQGSTHE